MIDGLVRVNYGKRMDFWCPVLAQQQGWSLPAALARAIAGDRRQD